MDFMSDALKNGRSMRTVNVLDDYNRESLAIDVDISLPAQRVIRSLQQIIKWRGKPLALRCDNGPEFISHELVDWATQGKRSIRPQITPLTPNQMLKNYLQTWFSNLTA